MGKMFMRLLVTLMLMGARGRELGRQGKKWGKRLLLFLVASVFALTAWVFMILAAYQYLVTLFSPPQALLIVAAISLALASTLWFAAKQLQS